MKAIFVTVVVLSGVIGLSRVMARCSFRYWVYAMLVCIPFDFGAPLGLIPRLSVIDYLSAVCMIALLMRYSPREIFKKLNGTVGVMSVATWVPFLLYGTLMAFVLHGSMKGVLRWGEFLFGYFVTMLAVSEDDLSCPVACLLGATGFLMAAWGLAQFLHSGGSYERTFAIFNQHNGLSAYLSLCLPAAWAVFISRKEVLSRARWGFIALIITLTFLAAYSRGAWLGLIGALEIVGLLRLVGPKAPSWYVGFGLVFMLAGAAAPVSWVFYRESKNLPVLIDDVMVDSSKESRLFKSSERTHYWKVGAHIFRAHPWVGLGPKNYDRRINEYLSPKEQEIYTLDVLYNHGIEFWQHLHNIYLQVLVEYGSIGLLLWAFAMAVLSYPLFRPLTHPSNMFLVAFQISGIAFLIHNGVDILFVNSFDLIVAIMLALLSV